MATNPTSQNTADISALSQTVNTMNGTLGTLVKTVYWGFGLSFVAIAGLALQGSNIKQDVGKVQGAIESGTLATTLKDIKDLLERPVPPPAEQPAQKSEQPPEKQGSLENLPIMMGGWTGVKAESPNKLADALLKTPPKGPVWVYTNDPAEALALEGLIK